MSGYALHQCLLLHAWHCTSHLAQCLIAPLILHLPSHLACIALMDGILAKIASELVQACEIDLDDGGDNYPRLRFKSKAALVTTTKNLVEFSGCEQHDIISKVLSLQ